MNKYSAKKIAVLAAFGLAVVAIASFSFIASASAASPSVQTQEATQISEDSAKLNGNLYTQGQNTTYWFEYGTNRNSLSHDTSERNIGDPDGRITVSNFIDGALAPDTTYYFRLVAENGSGIDRGQILSFRTDDEDGNNNGDDRLIVDTLSASVQQGGNSAVLRGRVDADSVYVQVWFRYGRSSGSLNSTTDSLTIVGDTNEAFFKTISNLIPGATYYYQAVGRSDDGTSYGQVLHFVASGNGGSDNGGFQAPLVITDSAIVNGRTSATLRAQVNPNGNLSSVWFEYGRSTALGSVTTRDPAGSGTSYTDYLVNVGNLSAGTTYYYRAVSQSTSGMNRGQILSFRTAAAPAAPVTPAPSTGNTGGSVTPRATSTTPVGAPDCFTVSPTISSMQLKGNDTFTYSVTYRNNCGQALSNGSLQITLPDATEFAGTNYPFLSRDGNVITYSLGSIASNFQSAVTVDGKVREQVENGDILLFQANVTFTDARGVLENANGYLSATVADNNTAPVSGSSTLGASAADALGGLFHSGWFWLVLFLILLALFVFWLATRRHDDDEEGEEGEDHGHEEHEEAHH